MATDQIVTNDDTPVTVAFDLCVRPQYPAGVRARYEELTRPGVDGHQVSEIGDRGVTFTWPQCHKWSSSTANAKTFVESVEALEGKICSAHDSYGVEHEHIMIERVRIVQEPRAVIKDSSTQYHTVYALDMKRME